MPAVKSIPIKDEEDKTVAYRFEPSNSFIGDLNKNYVERQDEKGRPIRLNKKLERAGYYLDRFEETTPKRAKNANRT